MKTDGMGRTAGTFGRIATGCGMRFALALVLSILAAAAPAAAQNPFASVVQVGNRTITEYEVDQRARFLAILGGNQSDLRDEAIKRLIDERIQTEAADMLGIVLTDEEIRAGMEEYAARTNLTADEFIKRLGDAGVAAETFRDFVASGLAWRRVVQARIARTVDVTQAEVDRRMSLGTGAVGLRVLLSEIFLPARTPEEAARSAEFMSELQGLRGFDAFAEAARNFSAAGSREDGGKLDWFPLGNLPPNLQAEIVTMSPGELTSPLRLPNALAIFQLRGLDEVLPERPGPLTVDYAVFFADSAEAARAILARADTCNDLYGLARDLPPERLQRSEARVAEMPAEIALALANLDPDESVVLEDPQGARAVMLCARKDAGRDGNPPDPEQVRNALRSQKIAVAAARYLAELRAETEITRLR